MSDAEQPEAPADAVLVEPARQQLVGLAAEVLGRLPAEDVPPTLRAIARFAPAKRQRLGAVALAAALDTDPVFRGRLADAVQESSPGLVAAVREGTPTTAADPVDLAMVAYLVRPQGWTDVLAAANRRWHDEHATSGPRDDTAALRAEVQELRAGARAEPARRRAAVQEATAALEAEVAGLRRSLRDRTRELRGAERDRDDARAHEQGVQAREAGVQELLDRRAAEHETELRRLRGRCAELERAVEAARRGARVERDVDDARLWLLVDTLVQAASGIRRELSLAPPARRPADALTSAGADTAGRSARDPAALDQLLALPNVHLIVDGYNVTKTGYGALPLDRQRARLIGSAAALAGRCGAEVTIAFDGGDRPPVQPAVPRGVRVLFSAADEIADDLIRRLVAAEPAGRPVVVATSDRAVVTDTGRDGAWSVPSDVLLARLG